MWSAVIIFASLALVSTAFRIVERIATLLERTHRPCPESPKGG